MSIVAGIDLGTTNCCVAVPADADIPDREALIERRRLRPLGGALIVANPDLSLTTPSAVWISPDGTPLVGALAKRKARLPGSPPAMFFKRNMGTDQPVTAGHATLTPLQASVHLLRHLRTVAQDALGVEIDRAVITVPAYFETSAKTQTTQAGAEAGLEVAETLMEPVAAALAHMHDDERLTAGPRRFLIYDLGGGTFDTSVVSWDPKEGFTSRSFDGDRYLGGYDFDQAIVDWVTAQLPAYDLRFAPGDRMDAERLARLLALAETAKHELSRETATEIISQDLEDRTGLPMNINLPLTRNDFDQMIDGYLRGTLDHCAEALAKAKLTPAELNEIVLVGGSSRIPLVASLLAERFGITPRLSHPELVVAVGAALKAGSLSTRSSLLELENPVPDGTSVDIAGRVLLPMTDGVEIDVVLRSADGTAVRERITSDDGSFLFIDVPLGDDGESAFTVLVLADGREVAAERLAVRKQETRASVPDLVGDILAHDFSVELLDRQLSLIVKAGTKIPHRAYQRLETATRGTTLAVRLYEGWIPIGTVRIRDLPQDVAPGTAVELTLEFAAGWTIHAAVRLPHLDRTATAVIDIPVRQVADWAEIGTRAARARADWRQVRREVHHADAAKAEPEVEQRLAALDTLVEKAQDQAKAHHLLLEAETILQGLLQSKGPEDYMEPPFAEFEENLDELTDLILLLQRDDPAEALPYRVRMDALVSEARAAYDAGDFVTWPRVNEKVEDLIRELLQIPEIREIRVMRATPSAWHGGLHARIASTDTMIRRKYDELSRDSRLETQDKAKLPAERDEFLADLALIAFAVDEVDLTRPSAREQLSNIYFDRLRPLELRISRWGREAGMRKSQ
ncbi:Hsp70 family protein [Nocardia sp. NPDC052566]|uniref:Hsp70 family protein n=1 Tax=Nocardia sp. NPDC052566 TaxID=3364330 RepID=UPI0037C9A49D